MIPASPLIISSSDAGTLPSFSNFSMRVELIDGYTLSDFCSIKGLDKLEE
jgi:hypothetical protein